MERRHFLSGLAGAAALGVTSGCLGEGGGGGGDDGGTDESTDGGGTDESRDGGGTDEPTDDGGTPTETGTPASPSKTPDTQFERTGDCPAEEADTASVTFGADAVTATGCITGNDGCQQAALADTTYDPEAGTLTVVVTTTVGDETPDVCTQQLVHRAYEARVSFDGGFPDHVTVVHESMGERTDVATASRE